MNKCQKCSKSPAEKVRPDGYRVQMLCHACCSQIKIDVDSKAKGFGGY